MDRLRNSDFNNISPIHWTVEQVASWIDSIFGDKKQRKPFLSQKIDGNTLCKYVTYRMLREEMKLAIGIATKIIENLVTLLEKWEMPTQRLVDSNQNINISMATPSTTQITPQDFIDNYSSNRKHGYPEFTSDFRFYKRSRFQQPQHYDNEYNRENSSGYISPITENNHINAYLRNPNYSRPSGSRSSTSANNVQEYDSDAPLTNNLKHSNHQHKISQPPPTRSKPIVVIPPISERLPSSPDGDTLYNLVNRDLNTPTVEIPKTNLFLDQAVETNINTDLDNITTQQKHFDSIKTTYMPPKDASASPIIYSEPPAAETLRDKTPIYPKNDSSDQLSNLPIETETTHNYIISSIKNQSKVSFKFINISKYKSPALSPDINWIDLVDNVDKAPFWFFRNNSKSEKLKDTTLNTFVWSMRSMKMMSAVYSYNYSHPLRKTRINNPKNDFVASPADSDITKEYAVVPVQIDESKKLWESTFLPVLHENQDLYVKANKHQENKILGELEILKKKKINISNGDYSEFEDDDSIMKALMEYWSAEWLANKLNEYTSGQSDSEDEITIPSTKPAKEIDNFNDRDSENNVLISGEQQPKHKRSIKSNIRKTIKSSSDDESITLDDIRKTQDENSDENLSDSQIEKDSNVDNTRVDDISEELSQKSNIIDTKTKSKVFETNNSVTEETPINSNNNNDYISLEPSEAQETPESLEMPEPPELLETPEPSESLEIQEPLESLETQQPPESLEQVEFSLDNDDQFYDDIEFTQKSQHSNHGSDMDIDVSLNDNNDHQEYQNNDRELRSKKPAQDSYQNGKGLENAHEKLLFNPSKKVDNDFIQDEQGSTDIDDMSLSSGDEVVTNYFTGVNRKVNINDMINSNDEVVQLVPGEIPEDDSSDYSEPDWDIEKIVDLSKDEVEKIQMQSYINKVPRKDTRNVHNNLMFVNVSSNSIHRESDMKLIEKSCRGKKYLPRLRRVFSSPQLKYEKGSIDLEEKSEDDTLVLSEYFECTTDDMVRLGILSSNFKQTYNKMCDLLRLHGHTYPPAQVSPQDLYLLKTTSLRTFEDGDVQFKKIGAVLAWQSFHSWLKNQKQTNLSSLAYVPSGGMFRGIPVENKKWSSDVRRAFWRFWNYHISMLSSAYCVVAQSQNIPFTLELEPIDLYEPKEKFLGIGKYQKTGKSKGNLTRSKKGEIYNGSLESEAESDRDRQHYLDSDLDDDSDRFHFDSDSSSDGFVKEPGIIKNNSDSDSDNVDFNDRKLLKFIQRLQKNSKYKYSMPSESGNSENRKKSDQTTANRQPYSDRVKSKASTLESTDNSRKSYTERQQEFLKTQIETHKKKLAEQKRLREMEKQLSVRHIDVENTQNIDDGYTPHSNDYDGQMVLSNARETRYNARDSYLQNRPSNEIVGSNLHLVDGAVPGMGIANRFLNTRSVQYPYKSRPFDRNQHQLNKKNNLLNNLNPYRENDRLIGGAILNQIKPVDYYEPILINPGHSDFEEDIYIPEFLGRWLKPHQISVIVFIYTLFSTIANDDKIIESNRTGKPWNGPSNNLSGIPSELKGRQVLILCPPTLQTNWQREFIKWLESVGRDSGLSDIPMRESERVEIKKHIEEARAVMGMVLAYDNLPGDEAYKVAILEEWNKRGGVLIMGFNAFRDMVRLRTTRMGSLDSAKRLTERIYKCLVDPGPAIVIADEDRIATLSRVCLTGYPLQNNLDEYWTMVNFVFPGILGSYSDFHSSYSVPISDGLYADASAAARRVGAAKLQALQEHLAPLVLRQDASVLNTEVPPKTEFFIMCTLTPMQLRLYKAFLASFQESVGPTNKGIISRYSTFTAICNHPGALKLVLNARRDKLHNQKKSKKKVYDFDDDEFDDGFYENVDFRSFETQDPSKESLRSIPDDVWSSPIFSEVSPSYLIKPAHSSKMLALISIIFNSLINDERVLVFSHFNTTIEFIWWSIEKIELLKRIEKEKLENKKFKAGANGIGSGSKPMFLNNTSNIEDVMSYITGKISIPERVKIIDRFNDMNSSARILLVSTGTGSVGVNLVGATRVVLFDVGWNPLYDEQAVARAYRYNQTKQVFVYRLISTGTWEQTMFQNNRHKVGLSLRVIDNVNVSHNVFKDSTKRYYAPPPEPNEIQPMSKEMAENLIKRTKADPVFTHLLRKNHSNIVDVEINVSDSKITNSNRFKVIKNDPEDSSKTNPVHTDLVDIELNNLKSFGQNKTKKNGNKESNALVKGANSTLSAVKNNSNKNVNTTQSNTNQNLDSNTKLTKDIQSSKPGLENSISPIKIYGSNFDRRSTENNERTGTFSASLKSQVPRITIPNKSISRKPNLSSKVTAKKPLEFVRYIDSDFDQDSQSFPAKPKTPKQSLLESAKSTALESGILSQIGQKNQNTLKRPVVNANTIFNQTMSTETITNNNSYGSQTTPLIPGSSYSHVFIENNLRDLEASSKPAVDKNKQQKNSLLEEAMESSSRKPLFYDSHTPQTTSIIASSTSNTNHGNQYNYSGSKFDSDIKLLEGNVKTQRNSLLLSSDKVYSQKKIEPSASINKRHTNSNLEPISITGNLISDYDNDMEVDVMRGGGVKIKGTGALERLSSNNKPSRPQIQVFSNPPPSAFVNETPNVSNQERIRFVHSTNSGVKVGSPDGGQFRKIPAVVSGKPDPKTSMNHQFENISLNKTGLQNSKTSSVFDRISPAENRPPHTYKNLTWVRPHLSSTQIKPHQNEHSQPPNIYNNNTRFQQTFSNEPLFTSQLRNSSNSHISPGKQNETHANTTFSSNSSYYDNARHKYKSENTDYSSSQRYPYSHTDNKYRESNAYNDRCKSNNYYYENPRRESYNENSKTPSTKPTYPKARYYKDY
ncbi:hypothetical protein BB559_003992 [Furculomyces boomerangus]|uniref:Uncharacterized protein n=1 Tax=Furculomyces boomerangus TaxID=61424 RepID=A0A2T9YHF4_9FUNG|nr:hypothetical protein BB559_003992 [Furculomyces boomerangus]